jgi:hypothetical protein
LSQARAGRPLRGFAAVATSAARPLFIQLRTSLWVSRHRSFVPQADLSRLLVYRWKRYDEIEVTPG